MYISNVTEYDNMTSDCNNNICTTKDYNFNLIIPSLLLTIPCGLSFLCFMSLILYTLFKPFFKK